MPYEQIQKISGSAAAQFGKTVAIKGYYALIADDSGNGYFYKRQIDGSWSEDSIFTLSGGATFGNSMAIGNHHFIVSETGYSSNKGRVGIYSVDDPSTLIQTLSPAGLSNDDNFGSSVAISDEYIVVGASGADSNRGDVYIYVKDEGDSWSLASGPITSLFRASNDYFGCAVAINNDDIIIGAKGDSNKRGAIYVFNLNSDSGEWEEGQKIFASDGKYNDEFGAAISSSDGYCVVGSSLSESSTGEINAGSSYIYKYNTTWSQVDKIENSEESSYEGNSFGYSVCINNNNIIIGSPDARGTGVADTFYKKRSWGHQSKILGNDSLNDDSFGYSVSISERFIIVGAPGEGSNGSVYFYENIPSRLRLAQEFDVNSEYLPSKATVYLKRVGYNNSDNWILSDTSKVVIDASNFSDIIKEDNIVIFSDELSGFTGNGYMILENDDQIDYSIINYPIRTISANTFNLWIRCLSENSNTFQADILIDGNHAMSINETVSDPSSIEWTWIKKTLVLPDINEHILGIKIKENGNAIDKLYIDAEDSVPYLEGPDYGESPYFTVHMKIYDSNGSPNNALYIYDYKNSINQIKCSDWYNFNIKVLDSNHGYTSAADFVGSYFMVMSASGTSTNNFVIWEMIDNDEYMSLPSSFKF